MNHLSSQGFNLSKSAFLCSALLSLASPYGIVSDICTVGFPTVTWSATVYQASSLFFKITHYGVKSYFMGNGDDKVDRFLGHCFMMFQACFLIASQAISAYSTHLSSSLILKTRLTYPPLASFSPLLDINWLITSFGFYTLGISRFFPLSFLFPGLTLFFCLYGSKNDVLPWFLVGSRCGSQNQLSNY